MEPIWLKNYPKGAPHTIDINRYQSLVNLLEESFSKFKDKVAFINYGVKMTYDELDQYSQQFANYLKKCLRLPKGSRVGIMLPNCLQYPVVIAGILRAGMVVVNINPLYKSEELIRLCQDADLETIVIFAHVADTLEKALPKLKIRHIIITELGDLFGGIKSSLFNFVLRRIKRVVPDFNLSQAVRFNSALKKGAQFTYSSIPLTHEDLAFLQYTGGTTGFPKGAMLSQGNITANIIQSIKFVDYLFSNGQEITLGALPLYHVFALTVTLTFSARGLSTLLITDPRDMKSFVGFLKKTPISVFVGLNTLILGLLRQKDFKKSDFSRLKLALTGGMPTQLEVAKRWKQITGVHVTEGYGLTEASPIVTLNPPEKNEFNGSIGLPLPNTNISIRDEEGHELPIGEPGELWIKGPQVMQGYWNNPQATEEVLQEGWLATGDIAKVDDQGFVYIVDRKKDMILISGFNVYPSEIESVISQIDGVQEVGVINLPNERIGERVVAVIVSDNKNLTAQTVIEYCRERLTGYKVPKKVIFLDELPKSNVGKVLKRELREQLADKY